MVLRTSRLVAVAALGVLLAGCVQIRSELKLTEDGLVEGFAEASFDSGALEQQGIAVDDVLVAYPLDEIIATPGLDSDNRIEQVYEQGGDVIVSLRFQGIQATDLEVFGAEHPFTRTPAGGFRFDATVETDDRQPGTVLRLQVVFPFEVVDTNGDLHGSTVSWRVDQGTGTQRLTAVTNDELYLSAPAGIGWLGIGFAAAAAVVLVGGFVAWRITRRSDAP